jgi:hypothetical protein
MLPLETLIVAVLLLIIGIAFCFGGYKWFMILLPVLGFLVGFIIGAAAVSSVYGESILSLMVIAVAGLIIGLILAVLVYMFFNLAIILLGASLGFTLGSGIASYLGFEAGFIPVIAGLIVAVIVGFLAFRMNLPKYIIIALTALIGSEALLSGALLLMGFISLDNLEQGLLGSIMSYSAVLSFIWLALAIVGAAVQLHRAKLYELDIEPGAKKIEG